MRGGNRKVVEPDAGLDALARNVIDAAFEVHQTLGAGFAESVYEEAFALELGFRGISFQRQVPITVSYKGHEVGDGRIDILVEDRLVVELKAVEVLLPVHLAQVVSYLRATKLSLGLLMTFNVRLFRDGLRRVVLSF